MSKDRQLGLVCPGFSSNRAIHLGNTFHSSESGRVWWLEMWAFGICRAGQSPSPAAFHLGDHGDAAVFNLSQAHFPYLISGANNNNTYVISLLSLLR